MAAAKKRAPKSDSRPRTRATTAERIQVIVDLMAELKWHPREIKRLAKKWGLSESRVRDLSAEAHRVVAEAIGDPEQIRSQLYTALIGIASRAARQKRPDFNSAVRAIDTASNLLGLRRSAIELTGKNGGPVEVDHGAEEHILGKLAQLAAERGSEEVPGGTDPEATD